MGKQKTDARLFQLDALVDTYELVYAETAVLRAYALHQMGKGTVYLGDATASYVRRVLVNGGFRFVRTLCFVPHKTQLVLVYAPEQDECQLLLRTYRDDLMTEVQLDRGCSLGELLENHRTLVCALQLEQC